MPSIRARPRRPLQSQAWDEATDRHAVEECSVMIEHVRHHPLVLISAAVCVLLVIGVLYRRRSSIHIPLMLSAFVIDVSMVVYLEVRRGVVESIPKRPMTLLLAVHIAISVIVLILYGTQVYSGFRRWQGHRSRWHYVAAFLLLPLRLLNFFTSILVTH